MKMTHVWMIGHIFANFPLFCPFHPSCSPLLPLFSRGAAGPPTAQPRPLDAGATPSFLVPGSKAAADGRFENLMPSLKLAIPKAPHGGCVVPGAHPHAGMGPAEGLHIPGTLSDHSLAAWGLHQGTTRPEPGRGTHV